MQAGRTCRVHIQILEFVMAILQYWLIVLAYGDKLKEENLSTIHFFFSALLAVTIVKFVVGGFSLKFLSLDRPISILFFVYLQLVVVAVEVIVAVVVALALIVVAVVLVAVMIRR